MADNQIKISVNLDSKEFDQNFKRIMDQVNKLRQATSGIPGLGGGPAANASAKIGGANQNINAQQSDRSLQGLQKTLEGLTGRTDTFNKSLSALSKTLDDLSNKAQQAATATTQAATPQQPAIPGGTTTPGGPGGTRGGGGVSKFFGTAAKGAAAIAGIAQLYGEFGQFKAGLPGKEAERDVSIAKSTGQFRERALRGESFEDVAFAPERARAIGRSKDFFEKAQSAREVRAKAKGYGGLAGLALGLGGIAATVATGGAALPLLGSLAAGGLGAAGVMSEEGYYGLTGNKRALEKMTGKEAIQEQEKYHLQEMMKDPYKYSQTKFLGQNRDLLSKVQKSTGLSDEGMYGGGGFVQRGADQFLFGERAGMQQQIVGAGGSVPGQSNAHLMALQAQRNLGLTNSGQAMGRLTNYLKPNESEDAFVKILAKGFSVGLDDSDYREESKDYLAQVTSIASRMGGGQEMVAARIAAGMGDDLSRRSVEKSAEAFQSLTQYQEETGGVTGATKFRLINEDPFLSKLKGTSRLGLQRLKRSDVEQGEKNPIMQEYLSQIEEGMAPEEREKFGGMAGLQKRLGNVFDKSTFGAFAQGKDIEKIIEQAKKEKDRTKRTKLIGQASTMAYGMGFGQSAEEATRMMEQRAGIIEEEAAPKEQTIMDKIFGPPTEGIEKTKRADAQRESEQFKGMQENFEKIFGNAMTNAGQALANQLVMEEFNTKLKEGGEKAVEAFIDAYKNLPEKLKNPGNIGQQIPAPKREVKGQ